MARSTKFDDNRLVDLVVQYDKVNPDVPKITATDIVTWARQNLDGYEELQPYHLTRPSKGKDKECTKKIAELNNLKKISTLGDSSILTMPNGIDNFFSLTDIEQRRTLQKTKVLIEELKASLSEVKAQNVVLTEENKVLQGTVEELTKTEKSLSSSKLKAQVDYILKNMEEEKLKEVLAQAGITDGKVSMTKYRDYLAGQTEELDFDKLTSGEKAEKETKRNTVTDILGGLLDG